MNAHERAVLDQTCSRRKVFLRRRQIDGIANSEHAATVEILWVFTQKLELRLAH